MARVRPSPKARPKRSNVTSRAVRSRRHGLTNGREGGKASRITLYDGLTNGGGRKLPYTLGQATGLTNGRAKKGGKGYANALSQISGLTNGNELTNGHRRTGTGAGPDGLTNGNGITNGGGRRQFPNSRIRSIRSRMRWETATLVVLASIITATPAGFYFVDIWNHVPPDVDIDGKFGDWDDSILFLDDQDDLLENPNIDLVGYRVHSDHVNFYAYLEVEGEILSGTPIPGDSQRVGEDQVFIFLDTDLNPDTGYKVGGLGADFHVKVSGHDGETEDTRLMAYSKTANPSDWNSWVTCSSVEVGTGSREMEVAVRLDDLMIGQDTDVSALVMLRDALGNEEWARTSCSPGRGVLELETVSRAPLIIDRGAEDQEILEIRATAIGEAMVLNSLDMRSLGTSTNMSGSQLGFWEDDGDHILDTDRDRRLWFGECTNQVDPITIDPGRIPLAQDDTRTFFISVNLSDTSAGTLGFSLYDSRDVRVENGTVWLVCEGLSTSLSYIGDAPSDILIDGAFGDWMDTIRDMDPAPLHNPNVDISEFAVNLDDDTASFYLGVRGTMMGGTRIPLGPSYVSLQDIVTDEPGDRPDTAPAPIPAPVSVPELVGEDVIYIFMDTDGRNSTGYGVFDGGVGVDLDGSITDMTWIGADRAIMVRGCSGVVSRSEEMMFCGTDTRDWSWEFIGPVDVGTDSWRLETQLDIDLVPGSGYMDVCFYAHDWNKENEDHSVRDTGNGKVDEIIGTSEVPKPVIRLRSGSFDPLVNDPGIGPDPLSNPYHLLQFVGPVRRQWIEKVESLGGQFFHYVPEFAYIVRLDHGDLDELRALPHVRWVGDYLPHYKFQNPQITDSRGVVDLDVVVFDNMGSVVDSVERLGGSIRGTSRNVIQIQLDSSELRTLAENPDVCTIGQSLVARITNNVADDADRLNVEAVWSSPAALNGTGQIVAVCDTGLDTGVDNSSMHDDFEGRIVTIIDRVGGLGETSADLVSGHGTHVAGSVLGNGSMSNGNIRGMAPGARLVFQAVEEDGNGSNLNGLPSSDLTELFSEAYAEGAHIHTNSWSIIQSEGEYNLWSYYTDLFSWENRDFLILFSASNDGTDANADGYVDPGSIAPPSTAKDCLTVGASENYRFSGGYSPYAWGEGWPSDYSADPLRGDLISDNSDGMVCFSSRGPVVDGRIKPDIVAPGSNILSVRSSVATGTGWGVYNDDYMFNGGTSMSTPLVAGCAALVRQYYTDEESISPSSSLLKATLINGATDMEGQHEPKNDAGTVPNNDQGWGRVNVMNSIFPSYPREMKYVDRISGFNETNQSHSFSYGVRTGEPLRINMVYTDFPALTSAGGLVNDLDLRVTAPDDTVYYGNSLTDGWSQPNPSSFDRINNLEAVYIQDPQEGVYTVDVISYNLGNLGTMSDQDYALVLSGAFMEPDDVGVDSIVSADVHRKNTQATVTGIVKNLGTGDQASPFDVRCVITDPSSTEVHNSVKSVSTMASLTTVSEDWSFTPSSYGLYKIEISTELSGDDDLTNDMLIAWMMVPRTGSALGSVDGVENQDRFGWNVSLAGDINGDSIQDVIVGAPYCDSASGSVSDCGSAFIFYGPVSNKLAASNADVIIYGSNSGDLFGWDVAGAGNIDGSGDWVIVGAPGSPGDSTGKVFLFKSSTITGSGGILDTTDADATFCGETAGDRFGCSVDGAGNLNENDNDDVVIGAWGYGADRGRTYVFYGDGGLTGSLAASSADIIITGENAGDWLGFSVAGAGDLDGDGYPDLSIGAPGGDMVYLIESDPDIPSQIPYSSNVFTQGFNTGAFPPSGWSEVDVSGTSGDWTRVSGSTYPTVSPQEGARMLKFNSYFASYDHATRFHINEQDLLDNPRYRLSFWMYHESGYSGRNDRVTVQASVSGGPWTNLGTFSRFHRTSGWVEHHVDLSSVSRNSDVDIGFLATGAYGHNMYLDTVRLDVWADYDVRITAESSGDLFGYSVEGASNVNSDSYDDLVIGAPGYDSFRGRGYLFNGGNIGSSLSDGEATTILEGRGAGDWFGHSVSTCMDVNNDGYDDILIGAPCDDTIGGGTANGGTINIYYGSASMPGTDWTADAVREGSGPGDRLGWCVSPATDMNDDSWDDILTGAPFTDIAASDEGWVEVISVPIVPEYPLVIVPLVSCMATFVFFRRRRLERSYSKCTKSLDEAYPLNVGPVT